MGEGHAATTVYRQGMTVFKYTTRQNGDSVAFFPMLDIVVFHKKHIHVRAYVDSGATVTYVPRSIARRAGILDDAPVARTGAKGVSGSIDVDEYILRHIAIMRNGEEFDRFNNLRILVPSDYGHGPDFVILGRSPLFSKYDITFSDRRKKLNLEKSTTS